MFHRVVYCTVLLAFAAMLIHPATADSDLIRDDQTCATIPTATVTWVTSCTNLTAPPASCWTPHPPTASDVVEFPTGTNAAYYTSQPETNFGIWTVSSLVVASGATVTLYGGAIQVTDCFIVIGTLTLTPLNSDAQSFDTPSTLFKHDPGQPEGTDCKLVPIGFTPRICGPGNLRVSENGALSATGLYASLFIATTVAQGGSLTAENSAFIWGNLTNYGTFTTNGWLYQHGFVFNYGTANMATLVFDKWATTFVDSPPIVIENYGQLTFNQNLMTTTALYAIDNSTGVYRASLINFQNLTFNVQGLLSAGSEFDIFNLGNMTWASPSEWGESFQGSGNVINKGTFLADGTNVYLSMYHSRNGQLSTINGGSFSFGNGAINPNHIKLCQQRRQEIVEHIPHEPVVEHAVKDQDRDCWWYGGFCYPYAYEGVWKAPQVVKKAPGPKRYLGVQIDLSRALAGLSTPSLCSNRYGVINGRVTGDGTGSVIATAAIEIKGTLRIDDGGRWYAMTEHKNAPVWGGGQIVVMRGGQMYLGVEADFNHPGRLVVESGGMIAVPRHATVQLTNHSLVAKKGSIVHVDGILRTGVLNTPAVNCGELRGVGSILKGKDTDFICSGL